jgi:hypothetical protein
MSLTVHARRRGPSGGEGLEFETPAAPHSELAGFEFWRSAVWGSPAVRRLGLQILPSLTAGDVCASGQQLADLEREVSELQRSLKAVVEELLADGVHIVASPNDPYETVRFRLANIAEAVRLARALPDCTGEVVIW